MDSFFNSTLTLKRPGPILFLLALAAFMAFMLYTAGRAVLIGSGDIPNPVVEDCRKKGFEGYASNGSKIECSNGKIKDGCVLTSAGFMCGDVVYASFKNSARESR